MGDKISSLLRSIRFWQVTIAAAVQLAAKLNFISDDVANVITVWLGTVAVVGTVDKAAKGAAPLPPGKP